VPVVEKPRVMIEKAAMLVRGRDILNLSIDIVNWIRRQSGLA